MTLTEAIKTETDRYLGACVAESALRAAGAPDGPVAMAHRIVHVRYRALVRLRRAEISQREALRAATPTVHAYCDLDGYR